MQKEDTFHNQDIFAPPSLFSEPEKITARQVLDEIICACEKRTTLVWELMVLVHYMPTTELTVTGVLDVMRELRCHVDPKRKGEIQELLQDASPLKRPGEDRRPEQEGGWAMKVMAVSCANSAIISHREIGKQWGRLLDHVLD